MGKYFMMRPVKQFFSHWYPLLLILVLGLVLRLYLVFIRGTYWFDEIFSIHYSSLPWRDALRYWILETNPPLYTFFLRGYLLFVDKQHEILVRLPSILFALLGIVVLYLFAQRFFGRRAGIYAGLFLALSNIHIFVSTEARTYTLLTFLGVLSCFLLSLILFEGKNTRRLFLSLFLVNALFLYSHLTAAFVVFIQCLFIFYTPIDKKQKLQLLGIQGLAFLLWLPWFLPSTVSRLNSGLGSAWYFTTGEGTNLLTYIISGFTSVPESLIITVVSALLLVASGFFFVRIYRAPIKDRPFLLFIASVAYLPILASALLSVFMPKYILGSYPMLHLVIAAVLATWTKTKKQVWYATVAILILLAPSAVTVATSPVFSWKPIVQYIEAHETNQSVTLITYNEALAFRWYYTGKQPVEGIYLYEDTLPLEERIVRHNWHKQETTEEAVAAWLETIHQKHQPTKIFIVEHEDVYAWVHERLLADGWTRKKIPLNIGYFMSYAIYEYDAPQ